MKGAVRSWINREIGKIHTSIIGTIVSYNSGNGRASVQPQGQYKTDDGRGINYPVIHNVPVQFPCGGGGAMGVTFPIRSGDGCLVVFLESQIDDFLGTGSDSSDPRKFSLNDAICIPGIYTGAGPTVSGKPNDVCIVNNSSTVSLGSSGMQGVLADGTSFSFSGGDLVVNGISVTKHVHTGDSGGTTSKPR